MSGLNRSDIDDIIRLIESSHFDELRLEVGDMKIELRRAGSASAQEMVRSPEAAPAAPAADPAPAPGTAAPAATASEGQDVPSPLLGTFYHAPKPGADPFVRPGDQVTPDTVIGIIEVMKLMNSVTAGVSGIVTEIVAQNGELVEHGDTLIRVKCV
ncbi:MAG: acetyl-CoA carboxylase biotin carboxyl carrier protein [Oricola sp.]